MKTLIIWQLMAVNYNKLVQKKFHFFIELRKLISSITIVAILTIITTTSYAQGKLVSTYIIKYFPPEKAAFYYSNADFDNDLILIGYIEVKKNTKISRIKEIAAEYGAHYITFGSSGTHYKESYTTDIDYSMDKRYVTYTVYQDGYRPINIEKYKLYREPEGVVPKENKELEYTNSEFINDIRYKGSFDFKYRDNYLEKYFFNNEGQVVKDPNLILDRVPIIYYTISYLFADKIHTSNIESVKADELASLKQQYKEILDREIVLLRKLFDAGLNPNLRIEKFILEYDPIRIPKMYRTGLSILGGIQKEIDEWDEWDEWDERIFKKVKKKDKPLHLMKMKLQLYFWKEVESLVIEYGGKV